ncbi:Ferredoxin--NADP reductase [Rubripirellula amarantea]|uniref:ferredoxin--NADP(+) reductase n=1 Tax=Rubripirellula amarantea TaxID=2527999 RepID=A0A5C5WFA4_9BACT|nr:ferredoxin--NADP reductase [Rubripirellula amarantea]TWT49330.1 Ferredoxin--NADP reductase [Rubripirellula amarantea]
MSDPSDKPSLSAIEPAVSNSGNAPNSNDHALGSLTEGGTGVTLSSAEIRTLKEKYYNATIVDRRDIHDDLAVFRIRPDQGFEPFEAGQYVALGLGNWERRIANCQDEPLPESKWKKLTRRAYSISCPMVDVDSATDSTVQVMTVNSIDYLEFYVALVRHAGDLDQKPPSLTPRLFGLQSGDRIEIAKKIVGHYVAHDIGPDDTVLMVGTGTGEAPHNAMAASLLSQDHQGRIIHVTSVRQRKDLAYLRQHETLSKHFPQYSYFPLTTRDPENLNTSHPKFVGKQYVQELFRSGRLAELAGVDLSPKNTHVFLCGNPAMIGYAPPGAPPLTQPGMIQVLIEAGFTDDHNQSGPGVIRFEKYW